jgi:hypothetical protein
MIAISSMTLSDAVTAMEMRIADYMTPYNSDWQTLAQYVRDARRDLFNRTNAYKEWSYQATISVTHLQSLPQNFIRPVRLTTALPGADPALGVRYEARMADPREWRSLTNTARPISFTKGWVKTGVYMVWANSVDGLNWAANNLAIWIYPNNLVGQLDYVASFGDADLNTYNSTVKVPVELEGLLIDMAISRFLDDVADPQRMVTAAQEVAQKVYQYQATQVAASQAVAVSAQAIPNPEPAIVRTKPQTPGGLL